MGEDTDEEDAVPLEGWLGAEDPELPELRDDELGADADDCGDLVPA